MSVRELSFMLLCQGQLQGEFKLKYFVDVGAYDMEDCLSSGSDLSIRSHVLLAHPD